MEPRNNEILISYLVKEETLPFEKELIKFFKNKGFEFWISGFDSGVRNLGFKKKEDKK